MEILDKLFMSAYSNANKTTHTHTLTHIRIEIHNLVHMCNFSHYLSSIVCCWMVDAKRSTLLSKDLSTDDESEMHVEMSFMRTIPHIFRWLTGTFHCCTLHTQMHHIVLSVLHDFALFYIMMVTLKWKMEMYGFTAIQLWTVREKVWQKSIKAPKVFLQSKRDVARQTKPIS